MTEAALKVGCIYTWELTKGQYYKKVFTDQHQIEKKKKVDFFLSFLSDNISQARAKKGSVIASVFWEICCFLSNILHAYVYTRYTFLLNHNVHRNLNW